MSKIHRKEHTTGSIPPSLPPQQPNTNTVLIVNQQPTQSRIFPSFFTKKVVIVHAPPPPPSNTHGHQNTHNTEHQHYPRF